MPLQAIQPQASIDSLLGRLKSGSRPIASDRRGGGKGEGVRKEITRHASVGQFSGCADLWVAVRYAWFGWVQGAFGLGVTTFVRGIGTGEKLLDNPII